MDQRGQSTGTHPPSRASRTRRFHWRVSVAPYRNPAGENSRAANSNASLDIPRRMRTTSGVARWDVVTVIGNWIAQLFPSLLGWESLEKIGSVFQRSTCHL